MPDPKVVEAVKRATEEPKALRDRETGMPLSRNQTVMIIREGDTLEGRLRELYQDDAPSYVDAVAKFNNLEDPGVLSPGQRVRIPPAISYDNEMPWRRGWPFDAVTLDTQTEPVTPGPDYELHILGQAIRKVSQEFAGPLANLALDPRRDRDDPVRWTASRLITELADSGIESNDKRALPVRQALSELELGRHEYALAVLDWLRETKGE